MSRSAKPNSVAGVSVVAEPQYLKGLSLLRFSYRTPTGIWKSFDLTVDVDDVLCVRRTVNRLAAKYKQLAQELANEL